MAIQPISRPGSNGTDDSTVGQLDDTDKAIIRHLQEDGRMPYTKLGPLVGLSAPATRQRVLSLIDRGAMQVVAVTDPLSLGFGTQAMIGVRAAQAVADAADDLAAIPELDYVVVTTGRFDLMCELVCVDNEHLMQILDTIRSLHTIADVEVFAYVKLIKQTYDWGTA